MWGKMLFSVLHLGLTPSSLHHHDLMHLLQGGLSVWKYEPIEPSLHHCHLMHLQQGVAVSAGSPANSQDSGGQMMHKKRKDFVN